MSKHLQNENFVCQMCDRVFNINKSLQAHYLNIHKMNMSTKEMKEFERQQMRLKRQLP